MPTAKKIPAKYAVASDPVQPSKLQEQPINCNVKIYDAHTTTTKTKKEQTQLARYTPTKLSVLLRTKTPYTMANA